MKMVARIMHPKNARSRIISSFDPDSNETYSSLKQSRKQSLPITRTEAGKQQQGRVSHCSNA
jgi:hypothetical protein